MKAPEGWSQPKAFYETNKIDVHLCAIMFWLVGGRVSAEIRLSRTLLQLHYCWLLSRMIDGVKG